MRLRTKTNGNSPFGVSRQNAKHPKSSWSASSLASAEEIPMLFASFNVRKCNFLKDDRSHFKPTATICPLVHSWNPNDVIVLMVCAAAERFV
jgi:hypothetical protein